MNFRTYITLIIAVFISSSLYYYFSFRNNFDSKAKETIHAINQPDFNTKKQKNSLALGTSGNMLVATNTKQATKPGNQIKIFHANKKAGRIGAQGKITRDEPFDNVFHIYLEDVSSINEAFLVYDLFGLENYNSVCRSINDGLAIGGAWAITDTTWKNQKEPITVKLLKNGDNVIRFSTPGKHNYGYTVRNVALLVKTGNKNQKPQIIVKNIEKHFHQNKAYVSGYLTGNYQEAGINIKADGQALYFHKGEFFGTIKRDQKTASSDWNIKLEAEGANNWKAEATIYYCKAVAESFNNKIGTKLASASVEVGAKDSALLELEGAFLQIDAASVLEKTIISMHNLREVDVMPTQSGLVNVTGKHSAYRMLPHGTLFNKPVRIGLPYDSTLVPPGHTIEDIRSYFFDEKQAAWVALAFDSLDTQKGMVYSLTNHFTDFINGIIEVPESPETQGYTPTSIKDLEIANPSAGIVQIAPPSGNNRGTANINYPIKLPAGRKGMQPQLDISYSSGGGSSWLGQGWSLSIPSISVETRWGVPRYNPTLETETYLMAGDQLSPVAHRSNWVARTAEKQFFPRIEGTYNKVIRHGNSPQTYWWEITSKGGMKHYYGSYDGISVSAGASLSDANGNIAEWKLTKLIDPNGNTINYTYHQANIAGSSLAGGKNLYPANIFYTGFGNSPGRYSIEFILQENTKPDASISCNYGFKQVDAFLLNRMDVKFDNTPVRSYTFDYLNGPFNKSLLQKITELDADDNEFYAHDFDYYNEVSQNGVYTPFSATETMELSDDDLKGRGVLSLAKASAISAANSKTAGGGLYVGIGLGSNVTSKNQTIGGSYNYSKTKGQGINALIDLNGDRLPDKVFLKNGLRYRPQLKNGSFGAEHLIAGGKTFQKTESSSNSFGFALYTSIGNVGVSKNTVRSVTENYFSDVNNDGFNDIVVNGSVFYNVLDGNGHPSFTNDLNNLWMPFQEGSELSWDLIKPDEIDILEQLYENPLQDVIRVWQAPYPGSITITGGIQLSPENTLNRNNHNKADGVRVSVQHKDILLWADSISDTDNGIHYPLGTENILVNKGDKIYFRVQSVTNAMYDLLEWDPTIEYNNINDPLSDVNGKNFHQFNAAEDFLLSSPYHTGFPADGELRIASYFIKPVTTDDIEVSYILKDTLGIETIVDNRTYAWDQTINDSIIIENLTVDGNNHSMQIRVFSKTNVDWAALSLKTTTRYTQSNDPSITHEVITDSAMIYYPVPYFMAYNTVRHPIGTYTVPRKGRVELTPILKTTNPLDPVYPGNFNISVKRINQAAVNKNILIENSRLAADSLLKDVEVLAGEQLYLEYHTTDSASYELLSDSLHLNFIVPDTLIVDRLIATHIRTDTTFTITTISRTWLSDDAITDSIFVVYPDGTLSPPSITVRPRSDVGYPEYILVDTLLTDTIVNGLDITINNKTRNVFFVNKLISTYTLLAGCYRHDNSSIFGPMYRHWGQFSYNKSNAEQIDEADLKLRQNNGRPPVNNNFRVDPNADYDGNVNNSGQSEADNPLNQPFIKLLAYGKSNSWVGYDDSVYIQKGKMSSSRRGEKDLVDYNTALEIARSDNYAGKRAINRKSKTKSTTFNAGVSTVVNFSGSTTNSQDRILTDFTDMNGDAFPDVISGGLVQYSNPLGGLSEQIGNIERNDVSHSQSQIYGASLNGNVPAQLKNIITKKNIPMSVGGGYSNSTNTDEFTFQDINGDGLPDKLYRDGWVQLNYGYSFGAREKWNFNQIRRTESVDFSATIGMGGAGVSIDPETGELTSGSLQYSSSNGSFVAGLGASSNDSRPNLQFMDINGDGLVDLVETSSGQNANTTVKLNTGSGFTETLTGLAWQGALQNQYSINANIDAAVTFGFTIPIISIKIVFNPALRLSQNFNRSTESFMDIDGDGYADYLQSKRDNLLRVRKSNIGRTNMLQRVNGPFGGSFEMSFVQKGNTLDLPNRQWVLSEVNIVNNHPVDGTDTTRTQYEYGQGYYDRYERSFFGFDSLTTKQIDTENNNALYRKTVNTYNNKNYYTQGLPLSQELFDGAGHKYNQSNSKYLFRNRSNGIKIEANLLPRFSMGKSWVPLIKETEKFFFDDQNSPQKTYRNEFEYDSISNIITFKDYGDAAAGDPLIEGRLTYHSNESSYIVNTPKSIEVLSGGNIYRKRETEIDSKGNITEVRRYITANSYATSNVEYNEQGNISRIRLPQNSNGQRMFYTYIYDSELQTYVIQINDAFGYSSFSEYDFRFGAITATYDLNMQPMRFQYDSKARLIHVIGPKEEEAELPFTIRHSYSPMAEVPWALTEHYDPANPGNFIETATFIDRLGRVIQIKKDAALYQDSISPDKEVMVVSGKVIYDAFGRNTISYQPVVEEKGTTGIFNPNVDNITPTTQIYDVLDRTIKVILPDGNETNSSYGFGNDRNGIKQFIVTNTDPFGNSTSQYTDVRGKQHAVKMPDSIWMSRIFDPIGQILQVIDPENNSTSNTYDMLGRRLERNHPDAGITSWTYDNAGNMLTNKPAHINQPITYAYNYNRLSDINYPDNPYNNVHYEYGEAGAENNCAGRIKLMEDATGGQLYYYGNMGEVVKNVRTVVVPDNGSYGFKTEWKYDSWNRLEKIVYPDGEVVNYQYNNGGLLKNMTGEKGLSKYNYIKKIAYDKFEKRRYIAYGNNTQTSYIYDPLRHWLTNLQTTASSGRIIQKNNYQYDVVGNIIRLENNADIVTDNKLFGGPIVHNYSYDNRYQLSSASGNFTGKDKLHRYNLQMDYSNMGDILNKQQLCESKFIEGSNPQWQSNEKNSHYFSYNYEGNKPHLLTSLDNAMDNKKRVYQYDKGGNTLSEEIIGEGIEKQILWTEENRMAAIKSKDNVSHYIYDASGTRTLKLQSNSLSISINGASAGVSKVNDKFNIYPSAFFVVRANQYTKHFYIEGQRILSKIGNDVVEEVFYQGNDSTSQGGNNYNDQQQALEEQLRSNMQRLGLDWYRDGNGDVTPKYVKNYLLAQEIGNKVSGSNTNSSGLDSIINSDPTYELKQYYFHQDHLGSSSYLTDIYGEVYQHAEYLPFGELFIEERNTEQDGNPYLYNGKELDEMTGLYYYGARYYDPAVGRFHGVDPHAERYSSWSPYSYVMNNPINAIDPDGRDVILLVWATGNGGYGHAAVAVSNYKKEYYNVTENGKTVRKSRMVTDGTYTYYDLWPGVDNNNDGVSDGIGSAGPKDAFSGPIAEYQVFKNLSENDLINGDPSGGEGKVADGVVKLYSGYEEDMEAIDDIQSHMSSNTEYTSVTNNCSDLATSGVAEALDRYKWWIESFGADESTYGISYTTPNSLYKYVRDRINSNSKEGKELRNPGSVIDTKFKEAVIDPAKQRQKGN